MDPAKHAIPDRPAAGRLGGKPFTPTVALEGDHLTFRQGKDFFADLAVELDVPEKAAKGDALKLTVAPTQEWGPNVPVLQVSVRKDGNAPFPETKFVNEKYALTLEIGKREKGKVAGKIYLCLPDADKSYLAGTFEAAWGRGPLDPPGPDDVPYLQGTVALSGKADEMVTVGYAGLAADGAVVTDGVGTKPADDGSGWARSGTFKPRLGTLRFDKGVPKFDFSRLPPGRYVVYARQRNGPAAWRRVEVKADSTLTVDLALDPKAVGTVELKVPAAIKGAVRLVPAGLADDPDGLLATNLGFALDYRAEPKDGKATIPNVPPGKYHVLSESGSLTPLGTVEVAAGKTATVELKPAGK
jgi:hypothetical protein